MSKKNPTFICHHDHQHCIDDALTSAKRICKDQQQRLTPIRELVLRMIWSSHKPLGAYDLLPALANAGFNSAPPTVYRALEFLQELGLVHRLASLNAFIGCTHPDSAHSGHFFICKQCKQAHEITSPELSLTLQTHAQQLGFSIEQETVEVLGICPECQLANQKSEEHHAKPS